MSTESAQDPSKKMKKSTWKVFWDLQCPYSKKNWEQYDALKAKFGDEYDFSIHLTSLLFHPQAFQAQCGASLIEKEVGDEAKLAYINEALKQQEKFMNAAVGDARKSEIVAIFASIAQDAGVFNDTFTKETFIANINDWNKAISPAWSEYKVAVGYGVVGTPKTVINEKLVEDTESAWGPAEWEEKIKSL